MGNTHSLTLNMAVHTSNTGILMFTINAKAIISFNDEGTQTTRVFIFVLRCLFLLNKTNSDTVVAPYPIINTADIPVTARNSLFVEQGQQT
jgi:hypothetical protein